MIGAVIFDMDGLLIDSEPLWVRAEIDVFGELGLGLDEQDCAATKGLRVDDVITYWLERRPWKITSPKEVEDRLLSRVSALIEAEGEALPGIGSALEAARQRGPIALASSSPMRVIDAALRRLRLQAAFSVVQSAENEPYGKPHPGIFLRTAEALGVAPTSCLVLEDSLTGVIAAKAARMTCIAVPVGFPDHDRRFAIADDVLGSLASLDLARYA